MAYVLKQLTGIDPLTIYSPTMTERLAPEDEDALYRHATNHGLVTEPVIFEHRGAAASAGFAFDAYVFFPRTRLIGGRPRLDDDDAGASCGSIPGTLLRGSGLRLIQAFPSGSSAMSIPQDQILIPDDKVRPPHLMLPPGSYWIPCD